MRLSCPGQSRGISVTGRGTDPASTANVQAVGVLAQARHWLRQHTSKTIAQRVSAGVGKDGTSLIMNDWWDLGNKAGATLESDIAPQPSDRDNETIPKAN